MMFDRDDDVNDGKAMMLMMMMVKVLSCSKYTQSDVAVLEINSNLFIDYGRL